MQPKQQMFQVGLIQKKRFELKHKINTNLGTKKNLHSQQWQLQTLFVSALMLFEA